MLPFLSLAASLPPDNLARPACCCAAQVELLATMNPIPPGIVRHFAVSSALPKTHGAKMILPNRAPAKASSRRPDVRVCGLQGEGRKEGGGRLGSCYVELAQAGLLDAPHCAFPPAPELRACAAAKCAGILCCSQGWRPCSVSTNCSIVGRHRPPEHPHLMAVPARDCHVFCPSGAISFQAAQFLSKRHDFFQSTAH
eukprot:352993-Chlamydomonas_euryale.AAC.3